jgi:hypothetical protein
VAEAARQAEAAANANKKCHVYLYEHPNFRGKMFQKSFNYPGGENSNLWDWSDRISSFVVYTNGAHCRLTLYDGDQFRGRSKSFEGRDKFHFGNLEDSHPRMDDNITSYRVQIF